MIAFAAGRECNNSIVLEQGLRAHCGYYYQKMDESSSSLQKKMKNMDAKINTAINLAVMGAGIAAAIAAANKSKAARVEASKIEKSISELSAKFDKMAEQLKVMQHQAPPQQQQKIEVGASGAKEAEKKSRGSPAAAAKAAGRNIYVRKSSEFSFYN
jgi:seryl-tRNA synthetase